jgi:hypothetical protein
MEAYKGETEEEVFKLLAEANAALTGASDAQLNITFFDTLREFFSSSNSWMEWINFMVIPDTQEYSITPVHGRILRLLNVIDQNRVPQQAIMPQIGTITFLYPYTTIQPMWACVTKTVIKAFRDGVPAPPFFPDWVLPTYSEGILSGVIGRMMMQSNQSWTDKQTGMLNLLKFRSVISLARVDAMHARTVGAQAWAFPQSYRTHSQKGGVSTFNINPSPQTAR